MQSLELRPVSSYSKNDIPSATAFDEFQSLLVHMNQLKAQPGINMFWFNGAMVFLNITQNFKKSWCPREYPGEAQITQEKQNLVDRWARTYCTHAWREYCGSRWVDYGESYAKLIVQLYP
jgi:hypothetical protein